MQERSSCDVLSPRRPEYSGIKELEMEIADVFSIFKEKGHAEFHFEVQ